MIRRVLPAVVAASLALGVAACLGTSPSASPSLAPATATAPAPSETPSPVPSPAPTAASPTAASLPPGDELVDVPAAGIRLAVPAGWEVVDATGLADPSVSADIVARHPGMARLMEAAAQMGDRATPALVALDPAAEERAGSPGPSVSVLVAQPAVSGPLLDFIAGFIADGFAEQFGSPEPARSKLDTPIGEAVRLQFDMPSPDGPPMLATAYVVGATKGTLLITVMGPPDPAPAQDPDALVLGSMPLP